MAEPTAADLRIKFYEDQKKARMEYYKRVKEDLGDFAKGVLDVKSNTNAAVNSSPKPPAAKVESTTTVTPMSPVRFEAPRGRQRGGTTPADQSGIVTAAGAFYHMYVSSVDGHTYLQGGTVTGGSGTETIDDIKVIDSGTGPEGADGNHLYINATGTGLAPDSVLIPGWNLTSATDAEAASVPSNTLPEVGDLTGKKCYVDLGVYTSDNFLPASPGNIHIYFCLGGYTVIRS